PQIRFALASRPLRAGCPTVPDRRLSAPHGNAVLRPSPHSSLNAGTYLLAGREASRTCLSLLRLWRQSRADRAGQAIPAFGLLAQPLLSSGREFIKFPATIILRNSPARLE